MYSKGQIITYNGRDYIITATTTEPTTSGVYPNEGCDYIVSNDDGGAHFMEATDEAPEPTPELAIHVTESELSIS